MKKVIKFVAMGVVTVPLVAMAVLWVGTRNLSDTKGNPYVEIAERNFAPNNDFTYSTNPSIKRAACRNYPVAGAYHPLTCINTVTSFYNPKNTCSYCPDFVRNPSQWGFHEVKKEERQPGDMIVFFRKGKASHAAMYIGESLFGPLMDHCDGGFLPIDYQKHVPYRLMSRWFWKDEKYYRHECSQG